MKQELWIAILNFATKFGLDAAIIALEQANKPAATIDDAIGALRAIQQKSADDFLAEARAKLGIPAPPPAPSPGG